MLIAVLFVIAQRWKQPQKTVVSPYSGLLLGSKKIRASCTRASPPTTAASRVSVLLCFDEMSRTIQSIEADYRLAVPRD